MSQIKTAAIVTEPQSILEESNPDNPVVDGELSSRNSFTTKQYRTNSSRRLSGRRPPDASPSLHSISSVDSLGSGIALNPPVNDRKSLDPKVHHQAWTHDRASHIISQVAEWLRIEKGKRAAHRHKARNGHAKLTHAAEATRRLVNQVRSDGTKRHEGHGRTSSELSDGSLALERLEKILSESIDLDDDIPLTPVEDKKDPHVPRQKSKRQNSKRLLRGNSTIGSSDTDYKECDAHVPSAEVFLDNSKTLGSSGGVASSEADLYSSKKRAGRENEAWLHFQDEIIRLAHTLRLKGWRRVPLARGADIKVERLSGALTNAVYVVSPPSHLAQMLSFADNSATSLVPRKPPP